MSPKKCLWSTAVLMFVISLAMPLLVSTESFAQWGKDKIQFEYYFYRIWSTPTAM